MYWLSMIRDRSQRCVGAETQFSGNPHWKINPHRLTENQIPVWGGRGEGGVGVAAVILGEWLLSPPPPPPPPEKKERDEYEREECV